MAVELTIAELNALRAAATSVVEELNNAVAEFKRMALVCQNYPEASSPLWSHASRATERTVILTALHAAAVRAVNASAAMHSAADAVQTAWT